MTDQSKISITTDTTGAVGSELLQIGVVLGERGVRKIMETDRYSGHQNCYRQLTGQFPMDTVWMMHSIGANMNQGGYNCPM